MDTDDEPVLLSLQIWDLKAEQVQQRDECRVVPAGEGGVHDKFRVVTRSELKLSLILP